MTTTNQRTKVERVKLEACLTCPLCNKLFREATTISECLHTFCRKCIYKKITDEDLHCCPICNVDLGVALTNHHHTLILPGVKNWKLASFILYGINSPNTYSSTQHMPNKVSEDTEAWTGTADLRKPLSHLVDATRKTKSKFVMQGDADKPVPEDSHANEAHLVTPKVMENGNNLKVHDDGNGNVWSRHAQKRKAAVPERLNVPEQTVVDTDRNCNRRSSPIWFSLVASDNQ
ncbi:E3 ubiquitin protein ligase DRIP2-like [Quillaja saponaria]|uniref:E3 ubiquitin protein ligase DRIP2-like n=1 Tax=Quillaja saponaria TaxID=32244 RepID=A0AAD7LB51_QUISA|nr:E3 ubiquitin protein ligase DRIP2-like [Quillaja saponaria]